MWVSPAPLLNRHYCCSLTEALFSPHVQDYHDKGSAAKLFVNYYGLTGAVKVGSAILLDDGLVSLRVTDVREESVTCMIENR